MEQSSHRLDQSGSASGPFPPQASSLPGSMGDGPRLPLPQPGPSLQSLYDQDHAQDDDGHDEGGPKKRKRIERACFGCRQRRSKCDGGMPCSVCTNNNSECTYPPPPRRVNIKYVEDLERRLADLEATQAQATQQQQSQPPQGAPAAALFEGPPSPRSQTAQPNTSFPTVSEYSPHQYFSASDSRKLSKESPLPGPEPRSSGSGSIPAVEEDRRRSSVRSHSDPRSVSSARAPSIRSVGGSNAPMLQPSTNRASEREFSPGEDSDATTGIDEETSRLSSLLEDRASKWERLGHDGVATEVLENAAARLSGQQNRESRLSAPGKPMDNFITQALAPSPSYDEMYALPSRVISDNLTSYYRSRIHYLFPILHWPSFMEKYEEAWSWTPDHKQKLKSSDHIFLATLNLIWCCATALRSEVGDTQLAATFFKRSQALVSVPHILLMGNLGIINYLLLLCKYSHSCSKGNLSSNAVGLAILMARGLHLHSQQVNETFGPLERILRQRAWAGCLEMEATSSAMLYRQTTSADVDFDPSGFPPPYDDDEITSTRIVPRDKDEPHKITFFLQSVKLFAIKCRILRQLYDMNSPKIFPHAHDVLVIEEDLLLWWKEVPEYLKKPETDDPDFILQSHVLASRYVNAQILLYRPFLFYVSRIAVYLHGQSDLRPGSYPVPDSLKFNLAIKSATVCADAAIELISRIVGEWTGMMLGWWWYSLGYVYSASLVILARRIVDNTPALGPSSDKQEQSAEVFRAALDFFIELGWHATEGLGPKRDRVPPESVQSTARRCYRILVNIERAIKNPKLRKEEARSSGVRSTTLVPPSRYSRKPDPSIPPLRLDRASNPFDDDHFISSWINLMQPASRDEAFVPKDFLAPTPFDLSHRANNPSAPPNHTQDHSYQNWASLLGSGFLSNFDPVQNVTPEDAMAGQLAGGSQRTAANTAQWWGGAEARQTTTSSTEARRSGSSDSRNQQAQQQQQQQQQQPQQQRPSQSTALNDVGGVGERASHRSPFGQGGPYTEQDVTNPDQGPIMGAVWGQPPQS